MVLGQFLSPVIQRCADESNSSAASRRPSLGSNKRGNSNQRESRDPDLADHVFPHMSGSGAWRPTGPREGPAHVPGVLWLHRQLAKPKQWIGIVSGDRRSFVQAIMAGGYHAQGAAGRTAAGRPNGLAQLNSHARGARNPGHRGRGRGRDQIGRGRGGREGRGGQDGGADGLVHGRGRGGPRVPANAGNGQQGGGGRGTGTDMARAGSDMPANTSAAVEKQVNPKHKASEIEEPMAKKKKGLRCSICTKDHFTNQCSLLRAPKPPATFCSLAGDGLGFFHIRTEGATSLPPPEKVSAMALVRIIEGDVSAELLKKELARILPVKW